MDFRHIEHMATSSHHAPSTVSSTASLLRIAHRRPDGSWVFTDAPTPAATDPHSDTRSEISSISPFATPLTPLSPSSHRFPPSPRGVPSVPHSVAPRHSTETITTNPGGYEKSVYSSSAMTHSPFPSISRSTHTSVSMSMSAATMTMNPSSKQHQLHIQNLPPSSPPPPMPLPPLPPTPSSHVTAHRSDRTDPVDPETQTLLSTQTQSGSSRRVLDEDVGSTRTGPPPYAAYIPTWREQQQMQTMPPLPVGPVPSSSGKGH
ncbi:hypothetical protein Clacol_003122 [Clathrus columnatus]|uniref:Uncharacterized protein n=1 Tax=Clathrus columnatus TaxID=1419009 RepID=A0AAV5A5H4_9AGAM|nr:hypothetical protein Clacol_003122 [Clathrus columnatus]